MKYSNKLAAIILAVMLVVTSLGTVSITQAAAAKPSPYLTTTVIKKMTKSGWIKWYQGQLKKNGIPKELKLSAKKINSSTVAGWQKYYVLWEKAMKKMSSSQMNMHK